MKILVCVKIIDGEINPFDECAVEAALSVKDSEVTVISMCPESAKSVLLPLTRLGVKRVILISDKVFAGSDTVATSYILSETIKKLEYDMIFCGRQTIDGETAQVGACLATMLGISLITNVMEICDISSEQVSCKTRMGEFTEKLPCLLTIEKINKLRFPSIRSKVGEVEVWDNSRINADVSKCGLSGSPTKVLKVFESVRGQRRCKFIDKTDLLPLIEKLSLEKKKETEIKSSDKKLKEVWAIGNEVLLQAQAIAENVRVIDLSNPFEIAQMAKDERPEVILWNADLWGRKNAPIVSALLNTGLCADCTALETDGEKLFMYRPAKGGTISAKIKCDTNPQMATVRTTDKNSKDIIVSGGRGIKDEFENLKAFAKKLGAEVCASRGLVDTGVAEYEMQVGLTGKMVCPKIYIAIGISGAVHHTVGIENADTVIAINPDKAARIFEYADYGIVCELKDLY